MGRLSMRAPLVIVFAAVCCASIAFALWYVLFSWTGPGGCSDVVLAEVLSADGEWRAKALEETCSDGAFTTTLTYVVQLTPGALEGRHHENDVLTIEGAGTSQAQVAVRWPARRVLEISVPAWTQIYSQKNRVADVAIRVRRFGEDAGR